jgi:hypothetical protein
MMPKKDSKKKKRVLLFLAVDQGRGGGIRGGSLA